jgi:vacuolar-type H+-ATPase subunit C/Vma6
MGYSVYPKLRAIYSFIPTSEDIESLLMAEGVLDFRNRFGKMIFLKRFPPSDTNLEDFLRMLPFSLVKLVSKYIPGSSGLFFDIYIKSYELSDIKDIINGGEGFFIKELRGKIFGIEGLDYYMQKGLWKDCWNSAFSKYKERHSKIDIEVTLDQCYYSSFLKGVRNLPYAEAVETEEFILTLINFKNRLWLYRLKKFYDLQDFEVRRFLIPEGNVYKNFSMEEGITENKFVKEFSDICYRDFKFRMYSMRSILAFFFYLDLKINEILSIYRGKLLNLERERFREIWEKLYVGS